MQPLPNPVGRPRKLDKAKKQELYLPPAIHGRLIDDAGNKRGAVNKEIVRILELYYATPRII